MFWAHRTKVSTRAHWLKWVKVKVYNNKAHMYYISRTVHTSALRNLLWGKIFGVISCLLLGYVPSFLILSTPVPSTTCCLCLHYTSLCPRFTTLRLHRTLLLEDIAEWNIAGKWGWEAQSLIHLPSLGLHSPTLQCQPTALPVHEIG